MTVGECEEEEEEVVVVVVVVVVAVKGEVLDAGCSC